MAWTDKKVALTVSVGFLVVTFPFWIWFVSNAGGAILSLLLEREPTRTELIGDYKYNANWGRASLHLDPSGVFEEGIDEGGNRSEYKVSWSSVRADNSSKVTFRPFGMVWDDNHNSVGNLFAMNFYKRRFGNVYAVVNEDLGQHFERQ